MNNLLTYFRLVDVRISASEKDLPVHGGFYYNCECLIGAEIAKKCSVTSDY